MEKDSVKKVKRNVVRVLAETAAPHQDDLPTDDDKVKRKVKARTVETDRSLSNKEVEGDTEEVPSPDEEERKYIKFISDLMKANSLALSPSPLTKGDGNCWFRAVADQVEFLQIPDKARNFKSLRLEVSSVFSVLI